MPFSPIPRGVYPSVTHISPSELAAKGIRLVLADLDNTLVPYHVTEPSPEVAAWAAELAEQGIQLFLLSNSRKPGRAQKFAEQLGIPAPTGASPIRGTQANRKKGAISGLWSGWAAGRRKQ